jgi:hypothetical protein
VREKIIVGIDPGANTGVAVFRNGVLYTMFTLEPIDVPDFIKDSVARRIVFEDSRLTSPVWGRGVNARSAAKIARNVGQIDAFCGLIVAACDKAGIPAHGVSPKGKGAKLNSERFNAATGWSGKSNQHERDAAMCAWPYRSAA